MTPSLSLTFEPPSTTVYGRSGFSVRRSSTSSSAAMSRPAALGQQLGELVDARLLAVHDAEAVRDERVAERGELLGERLRARRRPSTSRRGLNRRFSSTATSPSSRRRRPRARLAHGVGANATGLPSSSDEPLRDRREAVLRVGRAVGAPEVRADDDAGALIDEGVEGGKRRPHAAIVRDHAVLQRDVEVAADDDALAGERTRANRGCAEPWSAPRGARRRTR